MKVVVGIGNPGSRYQKTRHNLGFEVVDRVAAQAGIALDRRRFDAKVGDGLVGSQRVLLVKPQTYVNLTGTCVAPLLRWHRSLPGDLLAVCDDLNLELGRLRLRPSGSSGGHNGLESIVECLGTDEFARLRLGIGRGPSGDAVEHVLGRFRPDEEEAAAAGVATAAEAVLAWIEHGLDVAMNRFNR